MSDSDSLMPASSFSDALASPSLLLSLAIHPAEVDLPPVGLIKARADLPPLVGLGACDRALPAEAVAPGDAVLEAGASRAVAPEAASPEATLPGTALLEAGAGVLGVEVLEAAAPEAAPPDATLPRTALLEAGASRAAAPEAGPPEAEASIYFSCKAKFKQKDAPEKPYASVFESREK